MPMPSASLSSVLAGVNSIGLFASRAFVSAFAVAAVLKWGPDIDWINNTGLLQQVTHVPPWFTHDLTVTILGLLAALEIAATKSSDARALLSEVDRYIKSGTAFLSTLVVSGVITSNDAAVIREITAFVEPVRAGLGDRALSLIAAAGTGVGVWFAAGARGALLDVFAEADPDDDAKVQGLLSWAEDVWALFGTLLLFLFPLVMLGITALLLVVLALLGRRARKREEQSKTACTSCGQTMYRCALACPSCGNPNAQVHAIGWLGQSLETPADDPSRQPMALMRKGRCPVCATHLKHGRALQRCGACGHNLFQDPHEAERLLRAIDMKLPGALIVSGLLGLIPVIGLIPAIIVYRLQLIAPLRRYTSLTRSILTRWLLRLLFFVLVWVQVMPGVGALAVPVMALLSYGAYRRMFVKQIARERARGVAASTE